MPSYLDEAGEAIRKLLPRSPTMLDATKSFSSETASEHAQWMAGKLLQQPGALGKIDQLLGDHALEISRPLGSGAESLVFEVRPRSGDDAHVLKVRWEGTADGFDAPEGVPGIASYWAKEQAGPDVAAALQAKARAILNRGSGDKAVFRGAADRLSQSLLARGWHWGDGHEYNLGAMPDGTWSAIDGFIDKAHPSWTLPQIAPEEAIRMLRMTPEERAALFHP